MTVDFPYVLPTPTKVLKGGAVGTGPNAREFGCCCCTTTLGSDDVQVIDVSGGGEGVMEARSTATSVDGETNWALYNTTVPVGANEPAGAGAASRRSAYGVKYTFFMGGGCEHAAISATV